MYRPILLAALLLPSIALLDVAWARAAEPPRVEKYLTEGNLAEGHRELTAHLAAHPTDDEARLGLGMLEFLQSVENLGQSLHKYGALGPESRLGRQIPLLRLAVPKNPAPAKVSYADVRAMLQTLLDDLARAEATLAGVKNHDVKLPLHFGLIALDLNGDGKAGSEETLWRLYASLNGGLRLSPDFTPEAVQDFVIAFDYGDVCWLRGYCHLLSAIGEMVLAYDEERLFGAIAHHLFDNPAVPAWPEELAREPRWAWEGDLADAIAGIHLASFPLLEPARMKAAHEHLTEVIRLSRESWKAIEAETDDDHEWVPSPRQTGVIPNVRVTSEMIKGWHEFLDEAEQLLTGKKLIPHWRINEAYGVNLQKVFLEPREFDLVLWAHGAAALPYVEQGPVTKPETWNRLQRMFGGQFVGFAFWFN
ncbi:MAG: hypothetical protein MUF06_24695 [Pirellulaceae bacterium]|nr:hypothetical protein [Pirellulaceae bacterium]